MVLGNAAPKNLVLSLSIAPNVPPTILGDRDRVRQILLNLLANAVKFTLRGSIRLSISGEPAADGGEKLKFAVIDTGIGIPEDRLSRLFNRFSQADASIRDRFGGTGLGLAICKQLVERMGGEIGVETALGHGSTFWFTIRFVRAEVAPVTGPPHPRDAAPSRGIRILLVDDGRMNQEIARIFLEHAGYEVRVADSGAAGLEALDTETCDIVLMDMQMPGMDGLETTRRIRARGGRFAELPIIALSARVFSEDVAECLAAGMNGHLGKPFDRVEMVETIERFTANAA
jgi:CheY-like chemotaxis protein